MLKELSARVDEKMVHARSAEAFPGSTQTNRQRRQTKAMVLDGLRIDNIAQNIERDKHEKRGLLVKSNPLDVLPPASLQYLAGIDDATRSWIHAHNERITSHDAWLRSRAVRDVRRADDRIDVAAEFPVLYQSTSSIVKKIQGPKNHRF